jgi:hypothetical protein
MIMVRSSIETTKWSEGLYQDLHRNGDSLDKGLLHQLVVYYFDTLYFNQYLLYIYKINILSLYKCTLAPFRV